MTKRTRIGFYLEMDVEPANGQSPHEATAELKTHITQHLIDPNYPFHEDYVVTQEDLDEAERLGEQPGYNGYHGPFAMDVVVQTVNSPQSSLPQHLPADLLKVIENDQDLDTDDYSLFVLDGQSAQLTGDQDDWHDALVVADQGYQQPLRVLKYTRAPDGSTTRYTIA